MVGLLLVLVCFSSISYACWDLDGDGYGIARIYIRTDIYGLKEDRWQHITAVYDGTQMEAYINGTRVNDASTDPPMPSNATIWIGKLEKGWIDEVAIFDRAMTSAEVMAAYNSQRAGTPVSASASGLKVLWHFDVDTSDASGNYAPGTLVQKVEYYPSCKLNGCYYLHRTEAYSPYSLIRINPGPVTFPNTGKATVMLWFKSDDFVQDGNDEGTCCPRPPLGEMPASSADLFVNFFTNNISTTGVAIRTSSWNTSPDTARLVVGIGLGDPGDTCTYTGQDCNNYEASIHPNAVDVCGNGIDEDCFSGDASCGPTCSAPNVTRSRECGGTDTNDCSMPLDASCICETEPTETACCTHNWACVHVNATGQNECYLDLFDNVDTVEATIDGNPAHCSVGHWCPQFFFWNGTHCEPRKDACYISAEDRYCDYPFGEDTSVSTDYWGDYWNDWTNLVTPPNNDCFYNRDNAIDNDQACCPDYDWAGVDYYAYKDIIVNYI